MRPCTHYSLPLRCARAPKKKCTASSLKLSLLSDPHDVHTYVQPSCSNGRSRAPRARRTQRTPPRITTSENTARSVFRRQPFVWGWRGQSVVLTSTHEPPRGISAVVWRPSQRCASVFTRQIVCYSEVCSRAGLTSSGSRVFIGRCVSLTDLDDAYFQAR